jgi:hypothetical protein
MVKGIFHGHPGNMALKSPLQTKRFKLDLIFSKFSFVLRQAAQSECKRKENKGTTTIIIEKITVI